MPDDPKPPLPDFEAAVEHLATLVHEARTAHARVTDVERDGRVAAAALPSHARLAPDEREPDRITVRATLEGLRGLGYRLERDPLASGHPSRDQILAQADDLIARGEPLPAYDLTRRGLAAFPTDAELRLRNARALRRCGALQRALEVLDGLADQRDADGERRGVLAAVNKELYCRSRHRADSRAAEYLRRAQQLYQEVFDESADAKYWQGINAAALALVLGRDELARELANRVRTACAAAERHGAPDYWWLATRAEAALVLGEFEVAAGEYAQAIEAGSERIGDIASTRQNALLLLDAHGADAADRRAIEAALRPPAVVLFTGPPLDKEGAAHADFAPHVEEQMRSMLRERLTHLKAGFGFSGAAPGAELLFVEAMLERRPGIVNVVLPWPREQFVQTHVRESAQPWQERFESLLGSDARAAQVQHVVSATLGIGIDSAVYEQFARQLTCGIARIHAESLGTEVVPLVVSSGPNAQSAGALAELTACWEMAGIRLDPANVIDLEGSGERRRMRHAPTSAPSHGPRTALQTASRVMAILFADVEDYSKIAEDRLPAFIEYFVGGIGSRLSLRPYKPVNVRRVGDGLLMVFSTVRDAGLCALELVEWASAHSEPAPDGATFWSRVGLPREIRIRIALHAGPVFECTDPLTRVPTFEGSHINYAARIEPVTPGNQVYASEAFAALAASWPAPCDEFVCEYVGRTSLAKKAGEYPLYHVRRRG